MSASLQLWQDPDVEHVRGGLIHVDIPPPSTPVVEFQNSLNKNESVTMVYRNITYSGFTVGSQGLVKTVVSSILELKNKIVMTTSTQSPPSKQPMLRKVSDTMALILDSGDGNSKFEDQNVDQTQSIRTQVHTTGGSSYVTSNIYRNSLYLRFNQTTYPDKSFHINSNITDNVLTEYCKDTAFSQISNEQKAWGDFFRNQTAQISGGTASTFQTLVGSGTDMPIYCRDVGAQGGTIVYDHQC